MSIFRETFEPFVKDELKRRQDGMLTRTPSFLHQLNSRSAWVRMTSGVNVNGSNDLAKKCVLQGGILNVNTVTEGKKVTDTFTLKSGLGGASNAYSNTTVGGTPNRLGIKPMPGITNVSIQSKGAYGSLQEATVSFICWDIKQLEEMELLYMRPGYTVLFEMGWDYARAKGELPRYDILNKPDGLVLNDGFKQIYELIEKSDGNYNALLGYVKNYNWSARDDGGYDCTTSIISLGEILESLKCNWVPINTKAFDQGGKGILGLPYSPRVPEKIIESYKQGIIPGLIREIHEWAITKIGGNLEIYDNGVTYNIFRKKVGDAKKTDRGGLPKHLNTGKTAYELYITLESLCNLLNRHVLLKDEKNNPLVQVTTNEQAPNGTLTNVPLKCIASPLSLSTNLGVCYIENPNWESLKIQTPTTNTPAATTSISSDIRSAVVSKDFIGVLRFAKNITKTEFTPPVTGFNIVEAVTSLLNSKKYYTYTSTLRPDPNDPNKKLGLQGDINQLAKELGDALIDVQIISGKDADGNAILIPKFIFFDGSSFLSSTPSNKQTVNFLDYFGVVDKARTGGSGISQGIYNDLFFYNYDPTPPGKVNLGGFGPSEDPFKESDLSVKDNIGVLWTRDLVVAALKTALSNVSLSDTLQKKLTQQLSPVAQQVAAAATQAGVNEATKKFLVPVTGDTQRQLGNIGNIYVNLEYIYDKAISRNLASNDNQTKNVISIRDFLQDILRDVQNSIGNINTFDLQVDDRNSIGRIIDISSTQNPSSVKDPLFELQIHNLNSCVRTYNFQSKIFPEMGSIIAISAQDPAGIGTLGYDNATLVAWNDGISDRLIPKRLTNPNDLLDKDNKPVSYLLPFLTQMYQYFNIIAGTSSGDDINLVYGGLNFAFRDFLAHLDRTNGGNNIYKTIIPTELNITLDGIGGIIIGNLFKINEDIVPKGYKGVLGRKLAYIVTGLGHNISDNDWTTDLKAYPIVFEQSKGTAIYKQWKNQKYPGTVLQVGGRNFNLSGANLLPGSYSTANDNNPFNIVANNNTLDYRGVTGYKIASNSGLSFLVFDTEANGVRAGVLNLSNYFTNRKLNTVKDIINTYAPPGSAGQTAEATANYIKFVTNYLKTNWNKNVTSTTILTFNGNSETSADNIKMFKTLVKGIIKQEGKLTSALSSAIDNFDTKNL